MANFISLEYFFFFFFFKDLHTFFFPFFFSPKVVINNFKFGGEKTTKCGHCN